MAAYPEPLLPIRALVTTPDLADSPDVFPRLRGMQFVSRGTQWNTPRLETPSGRVFKTQRWASPINKFTAKYNSLNQQPSRRDLDRLDEFFNRRAGGYGSFYYWDPYRNFVSDQVFGTGDGNTTIFQLVRALRSYTEPVYAFTANPAIKENWSEITGFSLLGEGAIEFDSAPAAGTVLSWSGSFMFWCEFTQDNFDVDRLNDHLFSSDGLAFQTVKP